MYSYIQIENNTILFSLCLFHIFTAISKRHSSGKCAGSRNKVSDIISLGVLWSFFGVTHMYFAGTKEQIGLRRFNHRRCDGCCSSRCSCCCDSTGAQKVIIVHRSCKTAAYMHIFISDVCTYMYVYVILKHIHHSNCLLIRWKKDEVCDYSSEIGYCLLCVYVHKT
jgi:hypothetical protein